MEDWQMPDNNFLFKNILNFLILLPLTAFVIPSLRGTFTIQFINGTNRYFLCCFLLAIKTNKTKNRKARREKEREKKDKAIRKAVLCTVGYLQSLSAGRRQNVLGLMDWWELVPDVDHNRCIIKHPLWFSLRILNIFRKKRKHLLDISFIHRLLYLFELIFFLNWGPYFCGILSSTSSKRSSQKKFYHVLIPFHLLTGYIVPYVPAHLPFGSEQSHICLIKLEQPHLLWFQDCKVALPPESPCGGHSFPTAWPVAIMAGAACDTVLAGFIMVPALLPRQVPWPDLQGLIIFSLSLFHFEISKGSIWIEVSSNLEVYELYLSNGINR